MGLGADFCEAGLRKDKVGSGGEMEKDRRKRFTRELTDTRKASWEVMSFLSQK